MINLKLRSVIFAFALMTLAVVSCKKTAESGDKLSLEFEKYELENGLEVVLHQDKSDPIVSVAIQYGVGSNREKTGRTGSLPHTGTAWYRNKFNISDYITQQF